MTDELKLELKKAALVVHEREISQFRGMALDKIAHMANLHGEKVPVSDIKRVMTWYDDMRVKSENRYNDRCNVLEHTE